MNHVLTLTAVSFSVAACGHAPKTDAKAAAEVEEPQAHKHPKHGRHQGRGIHAASQPGPHGRHAASQPGHHHAFDDAAKWAKRFESTDRDAWQKPALVVASLELTPAMRVADIGSATGYFPVRIAKAVPEGRVWGVDIEPDMVRYLNQRARKEEINNLFSVLGHPDDALIPEPVDRVLVVNTYHHISERSVYFDKLKASLRPGGQVVIVDFVKGELPFGPPDAMKLAPDKVEAEFKAAGYTLKSRVEGLEFQYILVFEVAQ